MKKLMNAINRKAISAFCRLASVLQDKRGDLATNTIGAIIIAVIFTGLLVTGIKTFFPSFFSNMFASMETKLNANWASIP